MENFAGAGSSAANTARSLQGTTSWEAPPAKQSRGPRACLYPQPSQHSAPTAPTQLEKLREPEGRLPPSREVHAIPFRGVPPPPDARV